MWPSWLRWYWALALAGAAALIATGGAISMIGFCVLICVAWGVGVDRWRRRRAANATLRGLPFPVTHHPEGAGDADRPSRAIRSVQVRLRAPVTGVAAQRACRTAMEAAPLLAIADGDVVSLTCWLWNGEDLLRLAQLMSTWGVAVHADCGIAEVAVAWSPGGPSPSL